MEILIIKNIDNQKQQSNIKNNDLKGRNGVND